MHHANVKLSHRLGGNTMMVNPVKFRTQKYWNWPTRSFATVCLEIKETMYSSWGPTADKTQFNSDYPVCACVGVGRGGGAGVSQKMVSEPQSDFRLLFPKSADVWSWSKVVAVKIKTVREISPRSSVREKTHRSLADEGGLCLGSRHARDRIVTA